jgi:hypothetical protein
MTVSFKVYNERLFLFRWNSLMITGIEVWSLALMFALGRIDGTDVKRWFLLGNGLFQVQLLLFFFFCFHLHLPGYENSLKEIFNWFFILDFLFFNELDSAFEPGKILLRWSDLIRVVPQFSLFPWFNSVSFIFRFVALEMRLLLSSSWCDVSLSLNYLQVFFILLIVNQIVNNRDSLH